MTSDTSEEYDSHSFAGRKKQSAGKTCTRYPAAGFENRTNLQNPISVKNKHRQISQAGLFNFGVVWFLLFSHMILLPAPAAAQSGSEGNTETEDVIYLKNGGILRGKIIEITSGETVKIQTTGRNVFVIGMNDIDKITEEPAPSANYFKKSGYINHTGADFLSGPGETTVRFQMMNGYRFLPWLTAGIGVGYIPYRDPLDLVPVYLELITNLTRSNASPFLLVKAGYSFSIHSDEDFQLENHHGGWTINPGMGILFNHRGGFRWYLNAGYNVDHAGFDEEWPGGSIENDLTYSRVMFGIGFSF